MKRTLFDDDSDGESGKEVKLTTNKEFAKKYEKKKKREELAQCLFKAISFHHFLFHQHMLKLTVVFIL